VGVRVTSRASSPSHAAVGASPHPQGTAIRDTGPAALKARHTSVDQDQTNAAIAAAQAGSIPDGMALLGEYAPRLTAALRRFRLAGDEVDEVLHLAWVRALSRVHTYRGEGAFENWLTVVALNTARNHLRARERARRAHERLAQQGVLSQVPSAEQAVLGRVRAAGILDRLVAAAGLSRTEAEYIDLTRQGLTPEDVAARLRLSRAAVDSTGRRATKKLRRAAAALGISTTF
jgi:RNA polymerase sigma factor (sigma-70 family)